MATKTLWKIGGLGGAGTVEVVDTDGTPAIEINGAPTTTPPAAGIAALTPLADPATATSTQIATLLNEVVAALQA